MSCPENNNCIPCQSQCVGEDCLPKNYQDVQCDEAYPFKCSIIGSDITCLDIKAGDNGDVILNKIANAVCNGIIPGADNKFKISNNDTSNGTFEEKVVAGAGIVFTKTNVGANEIITVSANVAATNPSLVINSSDSSIIPTLSGVNNHTADLSVKLSTAPGNILVKNNGLYVADTFKTKVSETDTTGALLMDKLQAGNNITLTKVGTGSNETIVIASSINPGITSVVRDDSTTIAFNGTGVTGSPLVANVKLSTNSLNRITIDGEGLLVLPEDSGKVMISGTDTTPAYLASKLLPGNDVTLVSSSVLGNERLTINFSQTPITVTDSNTLDLSVSGTNDHTISANVKVSASNGNIISIFADGLYAVAPEVIIPTVSVLDTTSIDLSIVDNEISGVVRISSTIGNSLSINGTGLFVPAIPTYTAGAGIDITGNVISSTVVPVPTTDYNDLTTNVPVFSNGLTKFGTDVKLGGTLTGMANIIADIYAVSITGSTSTLGANNIPFRSTAFLSASGVEGLQLATAGVYGGLIVDSVSPFTPYADSKHGAISGTVYKQNTGNFLGVLPAVFGAVELSGSGNVTTVAALRAYKPRLTQATTYTGTVTNAVGLYIDDISSSDVVAAITNKYSIYQVGVFDTNLFNGVMRFVNLPTFADNSAASSLPPGTLYKTATGVVMVRY